MDRMKTIGDSFNEMMWNEVGTKRRGWITQRCVLSKRMSMLSCNLYIGLCIVLHFKPASFKLLYHRDMTRLGNYFARKLRTIEGSDRQSQVAREG